MSSNPQRIADLAKHGYPPGGGATQRAFDMTRRRDLVYEGDWDEWANQLTGQLAQEDVHIDEARYKEGITNQQFYEGNYFWRFNDQTFEIRDLPHHDVDPFFPHNWFAYFADLSVSASLEASPDIVIDPASSDERNIYAAREAQNLCNYLEQELITPQLRLETEKARQLYGGVWWYSYWSKDAGRLFAEKPVYASSKLEGIGAAYFCRCGDMGPAELLFPSAVGPICPNCMRRDQMEVIEAPTAELDEIIEYERIKLGFPVVECVSTLQMKGDRQTNHYMDGQWLRRKRLVDTDLVAYTIPWWDPRYGRGGDSDDYGLRAEEMIRSGRGDITSGNRDNRLTVVEQWWLQPAKYANVMFSRDVRFIGEKCTDIPAYVPLGEIFDNGLHLLKVGNQWVDHRGENFRKHFVYIPYITLTNKPDGQSLKDMQEPQKEIIHMRSLVYLYLLARAGGAPTIIKSPLSETAFDGEPNTITRIGASYNGDIKDLFFQPQFPSPDPSMSMYANQMIGEMQIISQTVSPTTTGDPSAQDMGGVRTARGMMIMNAKAQGLQGPKLMPLAYAQAQAVTQWIDLFRENVGENEVPIPLKGKTGRQEWVLINGANLEGELSIYPRAGSWMPRPKEERQMALQNAFSMFGQLLLDPNAPWDLKREIMDAFGLDFSIDDYDLEVRDATFRIEQMRRMLPQAVDTAAWLLAEGMISPDPETGQMPEETQIIGQILSEMCPPDQDLDDPNVFMNYFRGWLKGDEGKSTDPRVSAAVRLQWQVYRDIIQQAKEAEEERQLELQQRLKAKDPQSLQMQEEAKQQIQSMKGYQDEVKRLQEAELDDELDSRKQYRALDSSLREKIMDVSLQLAAAEGHPLPVKGKELVPSLGGLPSQPAM